MILSCVADFVTAFQMPDCGHIVDWWRF